MYFLNANNVEMIEVLNANARGQLSSFHTQPLRSAPRLPAIGLTPTIRTAYHKVAQDHNCLIFIRETGTASACAFYYGLGTGKPLDVKGKSSVATFSYGNIPFFARLSKTVTKSYLGSAPFQKNQADLIHQLENPEYTFIPKFLTPAELYTHSYPKDKPFPILEPRAQANNQIKNDDIFYYLASTTVEDLGKQVPGGADLYNLARLSLTTTQNIFQVFVREDAVIYPSEDQSYWTNAAHYLTDFAPPLATDHSYRAVYVLAQKIGNAYYEVVADYDLFAICPSVESIIKADGDTLAEKLSHFMPQATDHDKGVLSPFELEIGQALNKALDRVKPFYVSSTPTSPPLPPPPQSNPAPKAKSRRPLSILAMPTEPEPAPASATGQNQQLLKEIDLLVRQTRFSLPSAKATPKAVLHGCESNNYFHTVPYDFDHLICIRPVGVGRFELPTIPPTGYFELLLQRKAITDEEDEKLRAIIVNQVMAIGQAYIFPVNLAWGRFTIGQSGNGDFASQVATPLKGPADSNALLDQSLKIQLKTIQELCEEVKSQQTGKLLKLLGKKPVVLLNSPEVKQLRAAIVALAIKLLYFEAYYQNLPPAVAEFGSYLLEHGKISNKSLIGERKGWCQGVLPIIQTYKAQLLTLIAAVLKKKFYDTDNLYHFNDILQELQRALQ